MKKLLQFFSLIILICLSINFVEAQRPSIKPFPMTADKNKNLLGLTRGPSASNLNWQYWWVTSGLPVVGANTNVYVEADTIAGTWSITSKPSGSNAVISKIKNAKTNVTYDSIATFVADLEGSYIVSYVVGGKTALDTFYAGKYVGTGTITDTNFSVTSNAIINCGSTTCHGSKSSWSDIVKGWAKTKHATIFWKGVTGQLEFTEATEGGKNYGAAYRSTCVPCHTTGFNSGPTNTGTNSNNFFDLWLANKFTSPDTTGSYGYNSNGQTETMFRYDGSMWRNMSKEQKQLGTIGCESCHGPYVQTNHFFPGFARQNMISREIGICAQCHDSPNNHAVVQQFLSSGHGISELVDDDFPAKGANGNPSNPRYCIRCHTRDGFMKVRNPQGSITPDIFTSSDMGTKFTCVMCHQPHTADNKQVRLVTNATLQVTGQKITTGGPGQVCMYCHMARRGAVPAGRAPFIIEENMSTKDTSWIDAIAAYRLNRLNPTDPTSSSSGKYLTPQTNPHASNQADMLLGTSAFEFNEDYKFSISGIETHAGLESGCATCHMAKPTAAKGYSLLGYHTFNMSGPVNSQDATVADNVTACKDCHGEIKEFVEIKAPDDYDGNGKIEGVIQEVQGMIKNLEDKLFIGKWGLTKTTSGSWTNNTKYKDMLRDSTKAKVFFNYNFVLNDKSNGVHNTKYTIQLLSRSMIADGLAKVNQPDANIPGTYELSQNYPNPFNPSTSVNFSIPKDGYVKIYVYNNLGQLVATIIDSYFMAGKYTASWDGRINDGSIAASGVYFYKIASNNFVQTKKMMLMK